MRRLFHDGKIERMREGRTFAAWSRWVALAPPYTSNVAGLAMRLTLLALVTSGCSGSGNDAKPTPEKDAFVLKSSKTLPRARYQGPGSPDLDSHIRSEYVYADASGERVVIQNSHPKGGGPIDVASHDVVYGHALFFSRVINETTKSIRLSPSCPSDSFHIPSAPDSHFKLFLPPDTVTADRVGSMSYGVTGLEAFLNEFFDRGSALEKTLSPGEEIIFPVVLLTHSSDKYVSAIALTVQGTSLIYELHIESLEPLRVPCGAITSILE